MEKKSLYYKDVKGSIRVWSVFPTDQGFVTESGMLGGNLIQVPHMVPYGLGSRDQNEQIESMIQSRINKRIDRGYCHTVEQAQSGKPTNALGWHKPMLARRFDKVKEIDWSMTFVQRKFNGHRCIVRGEDDVAYSRGGKILGAIPEIIEDVGYADGIPIDGELYCHGVPLQTISSWAKKRQPDTHKLTFMVFDAIMDEPYYERLRFLRDIEGSFGPRVKIVPTDMCIGEFNPRPVMEQFIKEGYEGLILRLNDFPYEDGKRSKGLIKVKSYLDKEFKVVRILKSVDGWARLVCEVRPGVYFNCSAPGNFEEKTEVFQNKENYIGRFVNVQFPEYTNDGKPSQPVAVYWRDPEE